MKESSESALNEVSAAYRASIDSGLDLEFPDWNGQRVRPSTVTIDQMLRYCEAMMPLVKSKPGHAEARLKSKCDVEFSL
ncbi:MAG: hypothetical protein ABI651_09730 [Verrucomicrobiota bacterium]